MYTLQAQFLARNPVPLSEGTALTIFVVGVAGYAIFRSANNQKYRVRNSDGNCKVWGQSASYITGHFHTADGTARKSLLLTNGKHLVPTHNGSLTHTRLVGRRSARQLFRRSRTLICNVCSLWHVTYPAMVLRNLHESSFIAPSLQRRETVLEEVWQDLGHITAIEYPGESCLTSSEQFLTVL